MVPRLSYYPAVVTDADLAAAAEAAARDSMFFAAEWAQLTGAERARYEAGWRVVDAAGVTVTEDDADGPVAATSELDSITALQDIDRAIARLTCQRYELIGGLCPVDDDSAASFRAEQHLVEEIQVATRVGPAVAARDIDTARLLGGPFTPSRADLAEGLVSDAHVRVLVFETRNLCDDPTPRDCADCADTDTATAGPQTAGVGAAVVDPPGWRSRADKLAAVQARVAARAHVQTPSQFRTTVRTAIAAVDPHGEADRHAAAKKARDVTVSLDPDGMGTLVDRDDAASVQAINAALTDAAKLLQAERGGVAAARAGEADARLGACRADVLKTLVLGHRPSATDGAPERDPNTHPQDGPAAGGGGIAGVLRSWEPPARVLEGHLVIDLATLRGEADSPCLLDGQPIPAPVGRALAASVKAWRRMVTDPVTGHLLDYGRRVYLPQPLVAFTKARDGVCAAPYCERPARRCQMDHRKRFPDGPSAAWNCGLFCDRHHPLKTDGWIEVTDSDATGAITYRTLWGQTVTTSPHPYLPNPRPPTSEDELGHDTGPPGDDDPPF